MIQVYEKNGLFIIQNTITDIIYPNLTKQEAINLLVELGRTSDRVDNAIKDFNENNFQYESLEVDKTRLKYLKQQLADHEKKLEQSNKTIDNQSSLILEQNEFIKAYNQQLAEKDKEILKWKDGTMICNYEKMLAEKDQEITMLKSQNQFFMEEIKRLDQLSNLKDKEITSLQESLDWERKDKTVIVKQLDDPNAYVSLEDYKNSSHQICEKIRKFVKYGNDIKTDKELAFAIEDGLYFEAPIRNIFEVLDQIEKGE